MYLKRIVFLVSLLCLIFVFSISAYAKPEEEKTDNFFDTFVINQYDLKTDATEGNVGLYEVSEDGISILQKEYANDTTISEGSDDILQTEGIADSSSEASQAGENDGYLKDEEGNTTKTDDGVSSVETENADLQTEPSDINDYDVFKLYKGFSKLSVVTFADSKMLSGNGEENTTVGVMVFTVSEEGEITPFDESIDVIGSSGIYNASINLQIGENNVVIVVKKEDLLIYRLFKVTVKEEETKGLLENIQLNFIPGQSDDDSSDVDNPLPISNLPGFDAVEN